MRSAYRTLIGLGLSLLVGAAYAESGWTDTGTVMELRATGKHYYVVQLNVKKNPSGCDSERWFYQDYGLPGADKMFLTLLEAVKAGMAVRVYVTGRCNLDSYSEFSSVGVVP
jgi:hypothetical protein